MASRATRNTIAVLLSWLLLSTTVLADEVLDKAQSLLAEKKAAAAYELLKPLEDERAGDPNYDFLIGVAAIESQQPLEAVFALERVVDAAPDNGAARAELARAYLALGDTDDAKSEFKKAKQMDLPSDVEKTLDQYISTIDQYHDASRLRYRPYISTGLGYDSNVNSATTENQIAVPALGGVVFNLSQQSVESHSAIWNIAAGARVTAPLGESRASVFVNLDLIHNLALEESNFSTTIGNGQAGVNWRINEKSQFRLSADGNVVKVEGSSALRSDREAIGTTAQWQYSPNQQNQFTVFGQFSLVTYPEQRVRDVNRYTGGVGWAHAFANQRGAPVIFGSFFGGIEKEKSETFGPHFGRDFFGIRAGGQIGVHDGGTIFGSFTYQMSDYDDPDPTFLVKRDDDFIDASLGYRFDWDENWSVSPTVRFSDNDSNIVTSDYDRFAFMFTIRNDF